MLPVEDDVLDPLLIGAHDLPRDELPGRHALALGLRQQLEARVPGALGLELRADDRRFDDLLEQVVARFKVR